MRQRAIHILIAADQLVFAIITLGGSYPDETMSAAAWRLERRGKLAGRIFRPLIDALFFFDPNHCRQAYEAELTRVHLHSEYDTNQTSEAHMR